MRFKVYFVMHTEFIENPPRGSSRGQESTIYTFVDAELDTPIGDIIKEARDFFKININPNVCLEELHFQSIFDRDFQDQVSKKARELRLEADSTRFGRPTYHSQPSQPASIPVVSKFTPQQPIDQSADVACFKCSSKAAGYFKCKDGLSHPLCRLHCALEAVS